MHQRMKQRSQLAKEHIQDNWIILIMFIMIPLKSLKITTKNMYHNRAKLFFLKKTHATVYVKPSCIVYLSLVIQNKKQLYFYIQLIRFWAFKAFVNLKLSFKKIFTFLRLIDKQINILFHKTCIRVPIFSLIFSSFRPKLVPMPHLKNFYSQVHKSSFSQLPECNSNLLVTDFTI